MFNLIAITALAVSGMCAIGSSLWALSVYKGKRDERAMEQDNGNVSLSLSASPNPEQAVRQHKQFFIEPELDMSAFSVRAETLPEDVRRQVIALATAWPQAMSVTPGEDWHKAIREVTTLINLRTAQRRLNLDVPYIDYTQFIETSRPEDVEDLLRGAGRYRSLT